MKNVKTWLLALAVLCGTGAWAQTPASKGTKEAVMGMPRAEWSKAGEILMHTPGEELFNGVIHPSAGLFEDYFDVDQAAAEHRGYIEMLRKNGIRVHTVIDILEEVGIDSLRALAAKVLTYDISSIAGEDEILLSQLLEKLGVTEITLSDVVSVSFSNPNYISIEQTGSDWLLRSLAPFSTEEVLVLTLTNGETVEIKVTDEQTTGGTWNNDSSGNGTWSIDENGVLTITGTGAMIEYTGVTGTPWYDYINKNSGSDLFATKLVFENGITTVGKNSFTRPFYVEEINAQNCTTLTTIGESAFKQNSLTGGSPNNKFNPKRVDFSGCTSLNKINSNAFQLCEGIEYLDISDTLLSASHLSNTTAGFGASKGTIQTLKILILNRQHKRN